MTKTRKCKYGERLSNGKCPKKPKTRKLRSCKYGERLSNGKCPKKPKTRKLRSCKYGERLSNGKCPKKSNKKKLKLISPKLKSLSKSKSKSNSNKMDNQYLVTIHFPSDFKWFTKKSKQDHVAQLFGEAFVMDADADLVGENIKIDGNTVTFTLIQQTVDEPTGDFTKENINNVLEYVKNDTGVDFSFTVR